MTYIGVLTDLQAVTLDCTMLVTTTIRLRFDFDSTAVRPPFDCLSKVIQPTDMLHTSLSHADRYIYYALAPRVGALSDDARLTSDV